MQIGELARRTGVTVETIRYYEARGLIARSRRRASGYREFGTDAVHQIAFIGRAQSLGFSLTEVQELMQLRQRAWAGDATARVRDAMASKLQAVDQRLGELRELRNELAALMAACDAACVATSRRAPRAGAAPGMDCPLVEALDDADGTPAARRASGRDGSSAAGPSNPGRRTGRQRQVPAIPRSISQRKAQ
ncbi:MAG TPA: MerR family transcriptional regulator [Gemmatimonadaceae bacterium]|nr:MerR family transcriptional regulator [Gemmatimonadaceae bacterium]